MRPDDRQAEGKSGQEVSFPQRVDLAAEKTEAGIVIQEFKGRKRASTMNANCCKYTVSVFSCPKDKTAVFHTPFSLLRFLWRI